MRLSAIINAIAMPKKTSSRSVPAMSSRAAEGPAYGGISESREWGIENGESERCGRAVDDDPSSNSEPRIDDNCETTETEGAQAMD